MGGEIELNSKPGAGSRFAFTLNFQQFPDETPADADLVMLRHVSVLIAVSHPLFRENLRHQVVAWGMYATACTDRRDLLSELRLAATHQNPIRIVILDLLLQDTEMSELLQQLHSAQGFPSPRILLLTSSRFDSKSGPGCEIPGVRSLPKPPRQEHLRQALLELVDATTQMGFSGRVLLAEDNQINQDVAAGMLRMLGCSVDLANDGEEALAAARKRQYDLILMDCHMPEPDGFAVSTAIRLWEKEQSREEAPIVALTADVQKGVKDRCRVAGMTDHLSKPFTREQLAAILAKWLDGLKAPQLTAGDATPVSLDPGDASMLDTARLDHLRETEGGVLETAVNRYIEQSPARVQALQEALDSADAESLYRIAHNLKSSSASIGAIELSALCAALEDISRNGRLETAPNLVHAIAEDLPTVLTELQQALEKNTPEQDANLGVRANGQHIWLVDDDAGFLETSAMALSAAGFQVITASDANQVLTMSHSSRPDLLMLDAVMDGLDGFEVCRRVNAQWQGRDVPILMVTGLDDLESVKRAFAAGATGFIVKPINYPVLIHRLLFQLRAAADQGLLRENQERLATAQHMVGLGYWRWDCIADRLTVSDVLADLCSTTPAEFGSGIEALLQRIHEDDREYVRQDIQWVREHNTAASMTFRFKCHQTQVVDVNQELTSPSPDIILGTIQDVTEQKRKEEQIRKLAYTDVLTGLANMAHFQGHLDSSIRAARRRGDNFALMFLDLDGFKDVNDSLGHDVGDQLLTEIARRISSVLRERDFAARLGGDEFSIIIEHTADGLAAADVATRCLAAICAPIELGGQTLQPRASIGIAKFPQDGIDAIALTKCADSAMYSAKRQGKNRYTFYLPELTEEAEQRLKLEKELRQAMERDELELYYQPLISLVHGRLTGVEALLRWNHPQRGLLTPSDFFRLAIRIGLATSLDTWVLENACRQLARWQECSLSRLSLAVNCCTQSFQSGDYIQKLQQVLKICRLPADRLELDISDSVVSPTERNFAMAQTLRDLGVKLSIDHFGAELFSWAVLQRFPLDGVKLDRQFVQDMLGSPEATSLLGSMVAMVRAMNKNLLVEGVETLDQVLVLSGIGCELAQGDYFSPPVPANRIPVLAAKAVFPPSTAPPLASVPNS